MVSKELVNDLLEKGLPQGSSILQIQCALKLLGFMANNSVKQCTGKWSVATERAVMSFNWFAFQREDTAINYEKISELLLSDKYFKLPFIENSQEKNNVIKQHILDSRFNIIQIYKVPFDLLWGILDRETGINHYDKDGFLYVGCDIVDKYKIKSRGYGLGQITFKNYPLTKNQIEKVVEFHENLKTVIKLFKEKFKLYCKKQCKYMGGRNFLSNCIECIRTAPKVNIILPQATFYSKIQKEGLKSVPLPNVCDWILAVERYNGTGSNATAYKYLVLKKLGGD